MTVRRLAELVPYAQNARTHSAEQVAQIAASIKEFGWTNPVLLDESDGIIAGHGRVLAAAELMYLEVPTIVLEGLTPAQVRAYRLADNKIPLNAGWSAELLHFELLDLKAQGFELDFTGFSKMEQLEFLEWRAPGEHLSPPDAPPLAWWTIWREMLESNASVYIWGNPADLWRLWWRHIESPAVTLRNELVWDKGSAPGIRSEERRMYSVTTERCLFFMLGRQAFGNVNQEDYWDGFEPVRAYLAAEADKMRWGPKDIQALCGVGMFAHWFSKSQWIMIPRKHYETLQAAAAGQAFCRRFEELRATYDALLAPGDHLNPKTAFYETRSYFDNAHDNMTEVWAYPRVVGEERFRHATPKPVKMIERCVKSSSEEGALVLEPFGGTGSTLMAAHALGRRCYTMELEPTYCDVIVRRWMAFTGQEAVNSAGQSFTEAEKITAYKEHDGAPSHS